MTFKYLISTFTVSLLPFGDRLKEGACSLAPKLNGFNFVLYQFPKKLKSCFVMKTLFLAA